MIQRYRIPALRSPCPAGIQAIMSTRNPFIPKNTDDFVPLIEGISAASALLAFESVAFADLAIRRDAAVDERTGHGWLGEAPKS